MYQLYYADGSASMGIRVILEEIGVPYELIQSTIDMSKPRPLEQIAVNPNGWLPVLIGDTKIYEAVAITIFLCDKHPSAKLAPNVEDSARGVYLQTLVYFSSSIQNAFQLNYYPDRFTESEREFSATMRRGIRRLTETWRVIDNQIGDSKGVLCDNFSAVDLYLFILTTWIKD